MSNKSQQDIGGSNRDNSSSCLQWKSSPAAGTTSWLTLGVVALMAMFGIGQLSADDAATLVSRANQAIHEGKTEQALADYRQAVEAQPDRFEPLYNQAVAHYRMGQLAEARELFTQVLGTSDRKLEAKARFNLANCDYSEAVAASEQDRPAAIEQLKTAISHYRGALRANRSDTDSRANIELAKMLIDQLKEEEKQKQDQEQDQEQEQEQNQDQQKNDDQQDSSKNEQDQQNQDDSQQNDDSQENKEPDDKSESNQDKSDDQQQPEESKSDQAKGDDKEDDQEQKDKGDQGDKDNENQKQPDGTDGEGDAENEQPQLEDSSGEQEDQQQQDASQQAQPKPRDAQPDEQQEKEKPSTGEAGEPQGESDGQPNDKHIQDVSETEARPMTQEEAQKMLQAVRDRDMMRRYEKLRQMQRLKVPVDRDW